MKKLFFIIGAIFVLNGCQRENMIDQQTEPILDPQVTVFGGVVGQISDEFGYPVDNADVYLGEYETTSNELGFFEFANILIPEDGAYVEIEKNGYFHGSRTFSTELEETAYVKIQLLGQDYFEFVNASQGGVIEIEEAEIDFPAGDYLLSNGQKHTGEIIAYAKYLDPTNPSTYQQMPGQLTGINLDGEEKVLGSYGMIGVELTTLWGEQLALPEGSEAEIKLPIPSSLLANAPSTIPLWHFDEHQGTWIEEGEATMVGDFYIGNVKHFSFWNCDVPFDLVELSGNVQVNGMDYVGGQIKITDLTSGICAYSTTGARGFFIGKVPKNRDLLLEVIGLCGQVVFEDDLGSLLMSENVVSYNVASTSEVVVITGVLDNCSEEEIESGYIVMYGDGINVTIPVEPDGTFYTEVPSCSESVNVEFYGYDESLGLFGFSESQLLEDSLYVELVACDEFYESGYTINYEGQNWNSESSYDVWLLDFNLSEIPTGPDIEFNMTLEIIDDLVYVPGEGVQCAASFTFSNESEEADYVLDFESQGFRIEGSCEIDVDNFGPFDILIFSDVTDNIIVYDFEKYPSDVPEVSFVIRI